MKAINHHNENWNSCAPKKRGQENPSCNNSQKREKTPLPERLRLLLVENSSHDEISIVNELQRAGFEVSHKRVETPECFKAELNANPWDLIISDYCLSGTDGMALLKLQQQMGLD